VPLKEFDSSYDSIFGKKEPKERWVPPAVVIEATPRTTITFGNKVENNASKS
jgi:hypothetical protein